MNTGFSRSALRFCVHTKYFVKLTIHCIRCQGNQTICGQTTSPLVNSRVCLLAGFLEKSHDSEDYRIQLFRHGLSDFAANWPHREVCPSSIMTTNDIIGFQLVGGSECEQKGL